MAESASQLAPYFWMTVEEEHPSASKGKPLWTYGLQSGRDMVHSLHLGLQQPESPLSVHKSTYSVAYGERRYTNDLLTAALDSGDVSPVTSQQFLGNHFKDETRIKRVVAEALYAAYIVEWEVNFKPLRVGGGLGWNLDQLLHREPGTGPTVHFDPKRRRSLVKLQPAAKKWEAKIWVVDSAPEDDWEMERVCWVKQSSGGGGGRSAFTRRELKLWAGDRFLIRNSGYKMYLEIFARWMAELAAPQL
ncbi:MAG: hypothetical protein WDW36_008817 [Sanguina aurantia]